jgi:hypothetical protein
MKQAVGTSLFIIFINSLIGLVVYWEDRTELQIVAHHFGHGFWISYRNTIVQKLTEQIETCFWLVCIGNGHLYYRHRTFL